MMTLATLLSFPHSVLVVYPFVEILDQLSEQYIVGAELTIHHLAVSGPVELGRRRAADVPSHAVCQAHAKRPSRLSSDLRCSVLLGSSLLSSALPASFDSGSRTSLAPTSATTS